ncbi:MAG: flippase-like domain-containing protein [Hespellia sp.]|nr:flippase-like domain-containing protein [Hespellia sp.]
MSTRNRMFQVLFFLLIMGLTFHVFFRGQDLNEIRQALCQMKMRYLVLAVGMALFFVSAEGYMIWYLLSSMEGKSSLGQCVLYSFIGFFYSGITPSATGGQPMQLYYMQKDGNTISESSVVLMTVALLYKFVLVVMGIGILIFRFQFLHQELKAFFPLYILGLFLNSALVLAILGVMLFPSIIFKILTGTEYILVRIKIWKPSSKRQKNFKKFIGDYQRAVRWLICHKMKVLWVTVMTFLQRCSVFLLTYVVYLGFSLQGAHMLEVMILQASVYIAVDMLPLPGAQGITELMYQAVFANVFTGVYLAPSLLVSRGINFYFLLVFSLLLILIRRIYGYYKTVVL